MTPRRILVTGAAGFVGQHLLPVLRAGFPEAAVIASSAEAPPGFRRLDVTEPDAVTAAIRDIRPDACVHLAAIAAPPEARRDPDLAWRVNLHGTLALARAIMAEAPECRLLLVSSAEVYGASARTGRPLDETALPAPANTYAATKAAADLAIGAQAAEGLRAVRLRPFNHTGPGQSAAYVVAAFARQVARIEAGLQPPVMRVGALEPRRDFLDVRDVCAAYAACLRAEALEPGLILNLASGTPRRIGDILHDLLALAGVEAAIETRDGLLRPSEIPVASGDAGRAATLLGWRPAIGWDATLRDVLDDWRRRVLDEPPH
jgi:GDP-4-dehydro-6-deoxy-D-mannose reductase